jgi:hypothetical protein
LAGKPQRKRQLLKRRYRWDDSIKMVHKLSRCEVRNCNNWDQDKGQQPVLVNAVKNLPVPKKYTANILN